MKYYKWQISFFALMLGFFLLITQILYHLEKRRFLATEFDYFRNIIQDKNRRIAGLLEPSEEVFANYEAKLQVLEGIYLDYTGRLRSLLTEGSDKKKLEGLGLPFSGSSGIFINRRDRLYYQEGCNFDDVYEPGWHNRFSLALRNRHNDEYFSRAQTIIPYPVNYEQFAVFADSFQTLFVDGELIHRYFFEQDNYSVLLLIRLGKINRQQISDYVRQQFLALNVHFSTGSGDLFCTGNQVRKISDSDYGLHYYPPEKRYSDFLLENPVYITVFCIVVSLLYAMGGYRIIVTRFEFRFMVLYFLVIWLVYLGFSWFFARWLDNKRVLLLQTTESAALGHLKELHDTGFEPFLQDVGYFLRHKILETGVFGGEMWLEGFTGLIFKGPGNFIFSSPDLTSLQKNSILHFCAEALIYIPRNKAEAEGSPVPAYLPESAQGMAEYRQMLESGGFNDNFADLPAFIRQSLLSRKEEDKIRPLAGMGYHFAEKFRGRFFMTKALNRPFYFYWDYMGEGDDISLMVVVVPGSSMFELYLQRLSERMSEAMKKFVSDRGSFFVSGFEGRKLVYTTEQFDYAFMARIDNLWNATGRRRDKIDKFLWEGKSVFYLFSESAKFSDFRYLFLFEPEKLFAEIEVYRTRFRWFTMVYFFFALFLVVITLRRLLRPLNILKKGFMELEKGLSELRLPVLYRDESSSLLRRFNNMAAELERKKRMLPFVTDNLLELLGDGELVRTKMAFTDCSVVLFSDIRSFTTISETYPPEEVVDMLNGYFSIWQRKVEKYGGIVERFVGDAIKVVFFARNQRHYAQNALQTGIEVMEELRTYNQKRKDEGEFEIRIGIGIAGGDTGFIIVGGKQKMELVLLGEAARRSEELEALSKKGNFSHILVDETVHNMVSHIYDFVDLSLEGMESEKILIRELII